MIQKAPISCKMLTYDEAFLYCISCEHDGYTDWRMPTMSEWNHTKGMTGWYELLYAYIDRDLEILLAIVPVRNSDK